MPNTTEGLLLVIGGLFLMIALIGGGFEVSAAKIPPVGTKGRIGSALAGALFMLLAIRSIAHREAQAAPPVMNASKQDVNRTSVPDVAEKPPAPVIEASAATTRDQPLRRNPGNQSAMSPERAPQADDEDVSPPVSAAAIAPIRNRYYRLQLKHDKQYLDAAYCSSKVTLNPGSDFDGGSCELFRFIAADGGWSRLQLMHTGQYLDACSGEVTLSTISTVDDGACQLWRMVPAGDGWNRLRLKSGGQYLEAGGCTTTIGLNSLSDFEDGTCQMWRLVPQ